MNENYYVIGRTDEPDGIIRNYWWGPFTKEGANKNYLKRKGMYTVLKIVFDITLEEP